MRTYMLHQLCAQHRADQCVLVLPPGLRTYRFTSQDDYDNLEVVG